MIKIKIIEENNILKIKEDYAPIVCKNTNYQIEFEFGEDWNNIKEKTAIFIVENRKTAVDFSNNTVSIPAMPNAQNCQMFIISAEGEETSLISSTITLNLCPSTKTENIPEFEPLSNYVSTVISNVNAIKNGNIIAKVSEFASNVSNPNLLINGDFKVNQRGQTTYSETGKYTVDRWKLVSGTVEVVSDGITLNGTIIQKLEHTPSMQVVASSNAGTISYSNGAVTLSTTTATLITYAKLEVGTAPTPFSPRPYAEELAMCQRYCQTIRVDGLCRNASSNNRIFPTIYLPVMIRTNPTFTNITYPKIVGNEINVTSKNISFNVMFNNQQISLLVNSTATLNEGQIYSVNDGSITLDAEIY